MNKLYYDISTTWYSSHHLLHLLANRYEKDERAWKRNKGKVAKTEMRLAEGSKRLS